MVLKASELAADHTGEKSVVSRKVVVDSHWNWCSLLKLGCGLCGAWM